MFDGSFVAVFAVVAVAITIAEVEVVVVVVSCCYCFRCRCSCCCFAVVVVVVVIVVVVVPSPSSAALLWVQGSFHYCEVFIERQTNERKNSSSQNENLWYSGQHFCLPIELI